MKVIFVTRGWPSQENIMLGNYEAVQAKALAKRGIDVSVFCLGRKTNKINIINNINIDKICEDGVKVYKFYPLLPWTLRIIRRISCGLLNIFFIERALHQVYLLYVKENGEPDIIHGHIITVVNNCRYLLRKYNLPLVVTEHWSRINYPLWKEPRLLLWKRMYYRASQIIAVSNPLAYSLKHKFRVDSVVIGNMVNDCFFKDQLSRREEGIFKFVSVGNLYKRKGFDLLIKAFNKCKFDDSVCLQIIGAGQEHDNLVQLISEFGLQNQVHLLGGKKPEEVSMIMSSCDCYVLSSHVETFGIVCIEAMSKGLPVVATRCNGPEDIINDSNGILVPTGDVDSLAQGMEYIYNNINNYDKEKIKRDCYEKYSEESISKKIIQIYNEVLAKKNN